MNLNEVFKVYISYNYAPHVFRTLEVILFRRLILSRVASSSSFYSEDYFTERIAFIGAGFFLIPGIFYACINK